MNDAANDDDIINGTTCAKRLGIEVALPKWGISRAEYAYDVDKRVIAKGLASIKYLGEGVATQLYKLSREKDYKYFTELLYDMSKNTTVDTRQLDILIKIDFFSEFGNQRELLRLTNLFFDTFNKGESKQIKKDIVDGTPLEPIIKKYSNGKTKSGAEAKSYTILDMRQILIESEEAIKAVGMEDLPLITKCRNFKEAMGYIGYISNRPEDRRSLYVLDIHPLKRKSDGRQFGYSIITKSIGSGVEARFTVFNRLYDAQPILKDSVIRCLDFERDGSYFRLTKYERL